jgi:hypothetical protein
LPTENSQRARTIAAELRRLADEIERQIPPAPPRETARDRMQRLGWRGLIKGGGIAALGYGAARWVREPVTAAVLAGAAGSAIVTAAVAPAILPPLIGDGHGHAGSAPTATRYIPTRQPTAAPPPPTGSPTPAPSPTGTAPPTPTAAPTAAPTATPTPSPAAAPTGEPTPTATVTATETATEPPATSPPPATDEPPPPAADEPPAETTACRMQIALPPLLQVRLVCPAAGEET